MPSPATNALMSGTAQTTAGSRVRIPCDFGNEPLLTEGADVVDGMLVLPYQITSFSVTTVPSNLSVTAPQLDYPYQISALISGGTAGGTVYYVVYTITLNDPDQTVISRTGAIQVL